LYKKKFELLDYGMIDDALNFFESPKSYFISKEEFKNGSLNEEIQIEDIRFFNFFLKFFISKV
jgi:hypothetical protein